MATNNSLSSNVECVDYSFGPTNAPSCGFDTFDLIIIIIVSFIMICAIYCTCLLKYRLYNLKKGTNSEYESSMSDNNLV